MLGFSGNHGNKGAIALRFQIYNSTINFVNLHLFAGRQEVQKRRSGLKKIDQKLSPSDYTILLGDFNTRVQLSKNEYFEIMEPGQFKEASEMIEWQKLRAQDEVLRGDQPLLLEVYSETGLSPYPTYKIKRKNIRDFEEEIFLGEKEKNFRNSEYRTKSSRTSRVRPLTPGVSSRKRNQFFSKTPDKLLVKKSKTEKHKGIFENFYNKARVSSWTDRIFVKSAVGKMKGIRFLGDFGSVLDIPVSDHR
jgi:hypothetical protein